MIIELKLLRCHCEFEPTNLEFQIFSSSHFALSFIILQRIRFTIELLIFMIQIQEENLVLNFYISNFPAKIQVDSRKCKNSKRDSLLEFES